MKILKFIAAALAAFVVSIHAQQLSSIRGTILLGSTPMAGVEVTITRQDETHSVRQTVTDSDGNYSFDNLPPASYEVRARKGQDFQAAAVVKLHEGQNSLTLLLAGSISETVTISADKLQTIDRVSKTVDIVEGKELRERADFTLVDAVRTIPGFRTQQLGGFGRTASIKSRGLRNQDTAVLIDGVRFRDPSAITGDASAFLSDITLTSVSRIEVLRGSGSSLYGTNAIGGTIDFKTPEPRAGFHGQISGAAGGLGLSRFRGNVSDGTRDGLFGFNMAVSQTAYTKGIDGQDNAHNTNFQSRIDYCPFHDTDLSARFFVSAAFVRLNSDPNTAGVLPASRSTVIRAIPGATFAPDLNDPDNFQISKFFDAQVVATHVFNRKLIGNAYYSFVRTSRKNDNGVLGPGFQSAFSSVFDGSIDTINGHIDWLPNSANSVTAGYEFEAEKFINDGSTPDASGNFTARARQYSHAFFFQDLISLFRGKLQVAASARAQFFKLKTPWFSTSTAPFSGIVLNGPPAAYTFDIAASYFFQSTGTKFRIHVGNGYRIPSLYERFGTFYNTFAFPAPRFESLGDPFLRPERSAAGDIGIEQSGWGRKMLFTAVYFYTKLINTIGFGSNVSDIGGVARSFGGYWNTKGGISRGAEVSGKFLPFASTELFVSYTFTNSDQNSPQVSGSRNYQSLGIPDHQFSVVATQRFHHSWINADFTGSSSYLASVFDTNGLTFLSYLYRFKGNRRLNLTGGHTFELSKDGVSLRIFGTLENLLDYDYYENGFQTPGINGRIGLSLAF